MKTAQEIRELLEQIKLHDRLNQTPTDFVVLEVLLNINEQLAGFEARLAQEESRTERLNSRLENFAIRLPHARPST